MTRAATARESCERRFLATVLGDIDGDYYRDNLKLAPEAFETFDCRDAWRRAVECGALERALQDKAVQGVLAGADLTKYFHDRVTVWANWLRDRGPDFFSQWQDLMRTSRIAFPPPENEPPEAEILPDCVPIVSDLLEPGDKMIVASGSKSFKTWTLIQLGYCIANGAPWLGFTTQRSRVLFLNFEIKPRNLWRRVFRVRTALGLPKSDDFIAWNLRGKGFSMDRHADDLIASAKRLGVGVVILDPIYKLFGDRNESSAGDMATLMSLFDRVAAETGAAIVFAHHFAKGATAGKDSVDRASGSGVFARDPDCIFTLTRLDESEGSNTFAASVTLREFAPVADFAVRREHPVMVRTENVNVRNLHEPAKRTAKYSVEQVVQLLPDTGATSADWQRLAKEQLGMSRSTFFDTYAPEAKKRARLVAGLWMKSDKSDLVRSDRSDQSESGIKNTGLRTGPERAGPVRRDAA